MTTWSSVKAAWSSGWSALQQQASKLHDAAIRNDPTGYLSKVEAFITELRATRSSLDRSRALLAQLPPDDPAHAKFTSLEKRYGELAAGLYADAKPAPDVGVAPAVVAAGLVVGAAGIAWSVAAYQYAVNLREQTAVAEKELAARVEASRQGRTLQPSTVPPQPDPASQAKGIGWLLIGGLTIAAGVMAAPILLKRS